MFTSFIHHAGTLAIPHNVNCCDTEVDMSPQIWKYVLQQVVRITTRLPHVNVCTLGSHIVTHNITRYIWLHCSYVEGWWRIPCETLVVGTKWSDLEAMTLLQCTCRIWPYNLLLSLKDLST